MLCYQQRLLVASVGRAVASRLFCNMPVVTLMVHPKGLHPLRAAKAWIKHREEGMSLNSIIQEGEVVNMESNVPTLKTLLLFAVNCMTLVFNLCTNSFSCFAFVLFLDR